MTFSPLRLMLLVGGVGWYGVLSGWWTSPGMTMQLALAFILFVIGASLMKLAFLMVNVPAPSREDRILSCVVMAAAGSFVFVSTVLFLTGLSTRRPPEISPSDT